ncbi:MAG: hypothetical protein ACE5HX_01530 [bacterium]
MFDLDGVVINSSPVLRAWFWTRHGFDVGKNDTYKRFDYWTPKDFDEKLLEVNIADCIIEWKEKFVPYWGADRALKQIRNTGFPLKFISNRDPRTYYATWQWLNTWIGRPFELCLIGPNKSKKDILYKWETKIYVEDRFKICEEIAPFVDSVYCVNHKWNTGRKFLNNNIYRINNLWDLIPILE